MNLQNLQKKLIVIFWLIAMLEITAAAVNIQTLHLFAKPLLIPTLLVLLFITKASTAGKTLLITGLFFSWAGDVLLMFDKINDLFFIFGLICFLITHIFYIIYFLRISSAEPSLLKRKPYLIALVLAYCITLLWQLLPHLADLTIPVIVYAVVICTMLLCSLHIFNKVDKKSAGYYLAGAAAFVMSDSLLAINKFQQAFPFASVYIMLTYCAAQFFIVRGFIQQQK